jgi:Transglycosylase-like domain
MHTKTVGRLRPAALILASTFLLALGAQAVAEEMGTRLGAGANVGPATTPRGPKVVPHRSDLLAMQADRADRRVRSLHRPILALERVGASSGGSAAGLGSGVADWYATAACESGGRWDLNTGNGYWGGLQFSPGTWFGYGGGPFDGSGPFPYSAAQQIVVAERVLAGEGWQAWPNCFAWA